MAPARVISPHRSWPNGRLMAERHDHDHSTNCEDALAELYTFLDGELTPERRELIASHIDDCNPCLEGFDFEAELRIVVSQKCREEVPETLRMRIAVQLESMNLLVSPEGLTRSDGRPDPADANG